LWRRPKKNPLEEKLLNQWRADRLQTQLQEAPLRLLLWKLRSSMADSKAASRGPMASCLAVLRRLPLIGKKIVCELATNEPLNPNNSGPILQLCLPPCLVKLRRRLAVKVLCLLLESLRRRLSRSRGTRPPSSR
jgi:hypothetical protein